jgi:transposase-like protein
MSQKPSSPAAKPPSEVVVRKIRRRTRKQHSADERMRIVLEGLRGEESIAALCRREGLAEGLCCAWSKFLEAGKHRLTGDTARAATNDEVKSLRVEARSLKEVVAEQALKLRPLKKHSGGWGRPCMRYPAGKKLKIIRPGRAIPSAVRQALERLGITSATLYR